MFFFFFKKKDEHGEQITPWLENTFETFSKLADGRQMIGTLPMTIEQDPLPATAHYYHTMIEPNQKFTLSHSTNWDYIGVRRIL